jgi:hypothetical protein
VCFGEVSFSDPLSKVADSEAFHQNKAPSESLVLTLPAVETDLFSSLTIHENNDYIRVGENNSRANALKGIFNEGDEPITIYTLVLPLSEAKDGNFLVFQIKRKRVSPTQVDQAREDLREFLKQRFLSGRLKMEFSSVDVNRESWERFLAKIRFFDPENTFYGSAELYTSSELVNAQPKGGKFYGLPRDPSNPKKNMENIRQVISQLEKKFSFQVLSEKHLGPKVAPQGDPSFHSFN